MKTFLPILFLIPALGIYAQPAKDYLTPDVWLRADQLNSEAGYWNDVSGNDYHAIPADSFKVAANNFINYNKAVVFDGLNDRLDIPFNLSNTSQLTILAAYHSKGTLDERGIWSATINPTQEVMLTTQKVSGPQSIAKYSEGNMNLPVVNTTAQYWGKAGEGVTGASVQLGSAGSEQSDIATFSGSVAEYIVFDRLVSGVELQILQSYLAIKYGATLQYTNYLTSKKKVIWDYNANPGYSEGIAGIGRDHGLSLYQKQSSDVEEPGLLCIAANKIAEHNDSNLSVINNNDFLVWGTNRSELEIEKSDEEIYPYAYPVMERKWMMSVTGATASDIPTQIMFNAEGLMGTPRQCYLAIDRSGTGNFALAGTEFIPANNITEDGLAYFDNIQWDSDSSGNDVFTFSFGMDNGVKCSNPICYDEPTGSISIEVMGGTPPYSFSLTNDSLSYYQEWNSDSRMHLIEELQAGNYELKVTDSGLNYAENKIAIANPGAFKTGLDPEYTLPLGENLKLDAGEYVFDREAEYLWENTEGVYSTNHEVIISTPDEYTVTVTNKEGCVANEKIAVNSPGGSLYKYHMYPNPSRGNYKLDISLAEISDITVRVFNSNGSVISEETRNGAANYLFRGYINKPGLYLVEIETSFGRDTFKLIVDND